MKPPIDIPALLMERGPLTGREIVEATGDTGYAVWKQCVGSPDIALRTVGRRYLRLDSQVSGYARLSPSILREFLSYTVAGHASRPEEIERVAKGLASRIEGISKDKFGLAREIMRDCLRDEGLAERFNRTACAIIAGDIVYGMAHREPRPEFSTGRTVKGSDLDIVIIGDGLSKSDAAALDEALYRKKFDFLTNQLYLEEIDYLVKDIGKVEEQLRFDEFKAMIACKILHEGEYLWGSRRLFRHLKTRLDEHGIPGRLAALEQMAQTHRQEAEIRLLNDPDLLSEHEMNQLFFTTAEREEFF